MGSSICPHHAVGMKDLYMYMYILEHVAVCVYGMYMKQTEVLFTIAQYLLLTLAVHYPAG